jgi:hypothetical protein
MFPATAATTRTGLAAALTSLLALSAAGAAQAAVRPIHGAADAPLAPKTSAAVTFTRLDDPLDPTFNQLLGINNAGVISGYYGSGMKGHPNRGYTIAPPYRTFLSDNLPASAQTQATGINDDGTTSGFWAPTNTGSDANYGFVRWDQLGTQLYISVNDPLVASVPAVNQVLGVNSRNIAVGFYNDVANMSHGFAYSLSSGRTAPVAIPGTVSSAATGINKNNLVCGFFTKSNGLTHGYLKQLDSSAASFVDLRVPGSATTQFLGVNSAGIAVGFYNAAGGITHGLIYSLATRRYATVDAPGAVGGTVLNGLNDKGQAVGFYTDGATNVHGLLVTGAAP